MCTNGFFTVWRVISERLFFRSRRSTSVTLYSSSLHLLSSIRFDFYADLQAKLQSPAKVVPVFDRVKMQGEKGAVATVDMPQGVWLTDWLTVSALAASSSSVVVSPPGKMSLVPRRSPPQSEASWNSHEPSGKEKINKSSVSKALNIQCFQVVSWPFLVTWHCWTSSWKTRKPPPDSARQDQCFT